MSTRVEETLQLGTVAREAWGAIFLSLNSAGLPLDKSYASLQDCTLKELDERLTATFTLLEGLQRIDDAAVSLVVPRLKAIANAIGQIKSNCTAALDQARGFPEGFSLNDASGNLQLQVMSGGAAKGVWNLDGSLSTVGSQQMALLDMLTLSLRFGRYKGAGFFQQTAKELRELADELKILLEESNPRAVNIASALETAQTTAASIAAEAKTALEKQGEIAALVPEAQTKVNEIEAKLAHIKEISSKSAALEKEVEDYQSSFDAFQKSIDAKISAHGKFEENLKQAESRNAEREASIDKLIDQADTMIRGATTAGLSSSLDETRLAYEKKLKVTQIWFLGSVVVLLVCILPIAAQLIPGPWQYWFSVPTGTADNARMWLSALGKIILVLPATWATAFFAGNYAELFHLAKEYAHKAAMAKAVDGFKREAPKYEEEIVASVFVEISDNPGSRRGPTAAVPQNPLVKRVMETVLDVVRKKAESS